MSKDFLLLVLWCESVLVWCVSGCHIRNGFTKVFSDDDPYSPYDRRDHDDHARIVRYECDRIIILEHVHHGEEIVPVMAFDSHITYEWKGTSSSISDVDRDIGEVLPHPPEAYRG